MLSGIVRGETEQMIVIGAHYDHLGLGDHSSLSPAQIGQIHNGADDNASGTAGLLHLARSFAASNPRKGLVFIAFAGKSWIFAALSTIRTTRPSRWRKLLP